MTDDDVCIRCLHPIVAHGSLEPISTACQEPGCTCAACVFASSYDASWARLSEAIRELGFILRIPIRRALEWLSR